MRSFREWWVECQKRSVTPASWGDLKPNLNFPWPLHLKFFAWMIPIFILLSVVTAILNLFIQHEFVEQIILGAIIGLGINFLLILIGNWILPETQNRENKRFIYSIRDLSAEPFYLDQFSAISFVIWLTGIIVYFGLSTFSRYIPKDTLDWLLSIDVFLFFEALAVFVLMLIASKQNPKPSK